MNENNDAPKTHDTLARQTPYRHQLHPSKELEEDRDFAEGIGPEGPASNLSVDFDHLLKVEKETREVLPLNSMQVLKIVSDLEPDVAHATYVKGVERVMDETGFTKKIVDAEHLGFGLRSFVDRIEDVNAVWNSGPDLKSATFDQAMDTLYIGGNKPTPDKILLTIGGRGVLPPIAEAIREEMTRTHAQRHESGDGVQLMMHERGLLSGGKDTSLVDVLARRVKGAHQSHAKSELHFVSDFVKEHPSVDEGKVAYAVIAIDELQALGIPPTTICEFLKDPGVWCEMTDEVGHKRWVYKGIQDMIDGRAAGLGLDAYDVQGLVDADRLERRIDKNRAMGIFQEELIDAQSD